MRAISRYFEDPMSFRGLGIMLLAGICLGLFWVGMHFWEKYRAQLAAGMRTPTYLFLELCQTHQLSPAERNLLQQSVLDPNDLPQAFINPEHLEILSHTVPHQSAACRELKLKLFGQI
ncbi:MAG: hypothetical protein U0903_02160 [Planctomycetales bacterium]